MMMRAYWWLFASVAMVLLSGRAESGDCCGGHASETPCQTGVDIPAKAVWLPEGDPTGDEMRPGNSIEVVIKWTGGSPGARKYIHVALGPSRFRGQCTNSGDQTYEDFTIEQSPNLADWEVGDDLVYPGLQSLTARTREPVPADTPVVLIVTSYDWGGTFVVEGQAEGCSSDTDGAPLDTDGDRLPDFFEPQASYCTESGQRLPYNRLLSRSPGTVGPDDGQDDSDGALADGSHAVRGDGFTAWEEYRAFLVQGVVQRTISVQDPATGQTGGTDKKELYVFDSKGDQLTPLFDKERNKFLKDFHLIPRLIRRNEMNDEGELKAGVMNKNGNANQRAVWFVRDDMLKFLGEPLLGSSGDFSIKTGVKVRINLAHIQRTAALIDVPWQRLLDFVVAHELGHKLSLRHNVGQRTYDAAALNAPNLSKWADDRKGKLVEFWVPVFIGKAKGLVSLETLEAFEPEVPLAGLGVTKKPRQATVQSHGEDHEARIFAVASGDVVPQTAVVRLQAHAKNLMDPVPNPPELDAIEANPLTPEQEPRVDVKS